MNLGDFFSYKTFCPLCDARMKINFHSSRKQFIEIDNDCLFVSFDLLPLKPTVDKTYKVKYCFKLEQPEFHVEFYTKGGTHFENIISCDLISRCVALHNSLRIFEFYKTCSRCVRYAYYSKKFNLILGRQVQPIIFDYEIYCLQHTLNNEHTNIRSYQLINNMSTGRTLLGFWKEDGLSESFNYAHQRNVRGTYINLPLIPFVSKEETTKRLNNLIIFT